MIQYTGVSISYGGNIQIPLSSCQFKTDAIPMAVNHTCWIGNQEKDKTPVEITLKMQQSSLMLMFRHKCLLLSVNNRVLLKVWNNCLKYMCSKNWKLDAEHCRGRSGGAMVLGKLPVPGRPTFSITVGQGPTALAVGASGGCLDIFILIYPVSSLSPSLLETARYRLKSVSKGR